MADYNPMELMICVAARNLEDGATVVVGTGAPCATGFVAVLRAASSKEPTSTPAATSGD